MSTELDQIRGFRASDATVDAASRQAAHAALLAHIAAHGQPGRDSNGEPNRGSGRAVVWRRRWRSGLRVVAVAASVGAVVAVTAIALVAGHGSRGPAQGPPTARQRLIDTLGVLRRPQTVADRSFAQPGWPEPPRAPGSTIRPDRSLIRLATVAPWGAKAFLVPLTAPTNHVLARGLGETVALWVQGIGWSDFSTVGEIRSGSAWGPQRSYRRRNGTVGSRFFEIVPDGVARVGFYTHVQLRPFRTGGLVTAVVHHNIAAFQVKGAGARVVTAVWYAAHGRVIKRVGDWNPAAKRRAGPSLPDRAAGHQDGA